MKIKYNRVSAASQTGDRFKADKEIYDETLLDKVSGTVAFRDRPQAKKLIKLIESGLVQELIVEEFSRLGRNTGDVINTIDFLDTKEVNVIVRNLGLQSRPNGKKNPIWKLVSNVLSSVYEMELENIKERTQVGRMIYVQKGGILGRPSGTKKNDADFLKKKTSRAAIECLNKKKLTIRETSKIVGISLATVMKVKKLAGKVSTVSQDAVSL
ncbi:recombinase family protein [Pedobacter agri]|uniref:recombinase family protein n=1 Tax=Pedobacter agri TaxID=454586 RepID=UPI00278ABBF3|nr:recombinase family protein [Pedobacter agri]MDQ1140111.1 DNA invertase Pin-like site-specific DNA recombinase [Pedobacter agri]